MQIDKPSRKQLPITRSNWSVGGTYFITLNVHRRIKLFGTLNASQLMLNPAGTALSGAWRDMPQHNPGLVIDEFIFMPDHMHAIFALIDDLHSGDKDNELTNRELTVPDIVRKFKTFAMHCYGQGVRMEGWPPYEGKLWQRSYWSRQLMCQADIEIHRQYIATNPLRSHLKNLQGGDCAPPL